MSFVTWLALPVVITLIASLIMLLMNRRPRTNMHQDIESFARFRGALARQTTPSAPSPPAAAEEPQGLARTGIASSPDR